jgi:hypothetical protein
MHEETAEPVQNAAQVIESAAQVAGQNPSPVSGAGPSTLCGLFHSVVATVVDSGFGWVSAM